MRLNALYFLPKVSYTRHPLLKKRIVSYVCHMCVISIQIPTILDER